MELLLLLCCPPPHPTWGRPLALGGFFPPKNPQALGPAQSLPEAWRPHWDL